MLAKWTEILPVFIVRIMAKKYCERVQYATKSGEPKYVATARPDVWIKIED